MVDVINGWFTGVKTQKINHKQTMPEAAHVAAFLYIFVDVIKMRNIYDKKM